MCISKKIYIYKNLFSIMTLSQWCLQPKYLLNLQFVLRKTMMLPSSASEFSGSCLIIMTCPSLPSSGVALDSTSSRFFACSSAAVRTASWNFSSMLANFSVISGSGVPTTVPTLTPATLFCLPKAMETFPVINICENIYNALGSYVPGAASFP